MLFKIISLITGYITVLVRGEAPERLINMASTRGIWLWDIKWVNQESMMLSLRLSAIRPLRHIARETGCRFTIEGRHGLPFIIARLKRRKGLVVGASLFLVLVYMLSSFVWLIDVTGNMTIKDSEILREAGRAGLSVGVLKWNLDTKAVEHALKENINKVSWAGVKIKGTRVVVEIVEKKMPPATGDNQPAHILAAKGGLIKEVLVLKGQPAVEEGQTVKKGQILISGEIWPLETEEEQDPPPGESIPEKEPREQGEPEYVHARGIVNARIWYEGYGEALLVESGTKRTGNTISRICIKVKNKEIILSGPEKISYAQYDQDISTKRLPIWRNLSIPVEINTEQYFELKSFTERRSLAGAREKALQSALADVKNKLPASAKVLNQEAEQIDTGTRENMVRMKIILETLEDIGVDKSFTP